MMTLMMDYGSQFTGSTISSDTMSGSVESVQPKFRTVRLVRPPAGTLPPPGITARHGPNLGFCVRGGREHGTGFFVSVVDPGSEAHRQGLRVGDQIIRINGFTIDDAVHKEVLQLISNHTHLTLKVRTVGMIPVKENTDQLSWQIISDSTSSTRSSPQLGDKIHDVRINIMVAPRTKLGCGICKGPEWKPGIFVQFTKEGGISREAGLRPGDQILYCNNVDFSDIQFSEAVNIMKTSRQLDLIVRKSAGSELFPGESSGYNSSASSVTGDQSPSWSDSKRLSIVKEESLELEDRLSQLDRLKSSKWDKIEWDDIDDEKRYQFKPTIINLSENGSTISNNGSPECRNYENNNNTLTKNKSNKLAEICLLSQQQETKTVVVDVHRSNMEDCAKTENNIPSTPPACDFKYLTSRSSNDGSTTSLSSAISQELQRRTERKNIENCKPSIDEQLQKRKILKGVDTDKQQQHTKLMDEFKKVHRKMFQSNDKDKEETEEERSNSLAIEKILSNSNKNVTERHLFPPKVTERRSTVSETPQEKPLTRQCVSAPPPPPPPPAPFDEPDIEIRAQEIAKPKTKIAPPVPIKYSTLSFAKENPKYPDPPPCPAPDYDTISIDSSSTISSSTIKPSQNINEAVEMQSLESFNLTNNSNPWPKPPNTYFNNRSKSTLSSQLSNGSNSSSYENKKQRPVSVTIGEYPSGSLRKQPGKLDFLQNGCNSEDAEKNGSISTQFASELANTLSRSNLRKRTESMENLLNGPQIKPQSNGSVTISLNNTLNRNFAKSNGNLKTPEKSNRVTISISGSATEKKLEVPNGILKNGNGNSNFHHHSHKPLVQQKSITFGEMPTVINDKLLHIVT